MNIPNKLKILILGIIIGACTGCIIGFLWCARVVDNVILEKKIHEIIAIPF